MKTFQEKFSKEIIPALQQELKKKNVWSVPRIIKVKINAGIGKLSGAGKDFAHVVDSITLISGQKPVIAKARKAISNFKLKLNQPVGIYVTLRGKRMYDFLGKLINVVFPRVRDFRGISQKSFDGQGNYTIAIKENVVFPEISPDDINKIHGLEVTIVTTAESDKDAYKLLKLMGFPFTKTHNQ